MAKFKSGDTIKSYDGQYLTIEFVSKKRASGNQNYYFTNGQWMLCSLIDKFWTLNEETEIEE